MTQQDKLADALRKAFDLGQRYWMLADSESYSDNRKSADVLARFDTLTLEALAEHDAQPAPAPVQVGGLKGDARLAHDQCRAVVQMARALGLLPEA